MTKQQSVIDDAWESAVGGLDWLKSVLLGEFSDDRPLSAIVADMLLSFVPGVVIVTSARDAAAVILRLAAHPERREEMMEWILLCACMITLALPLAMAAGGAAAAGVGAVVGGIAGSELGAALRAVMLLLIKEAAKLGDVIRFLQKFVRGDIVQFLRAVRFVRFERALMMALKKTIGKLVEVCKGTRSYLEKLSYFEDARHAVRVLITWENRFYAVQKAAMEQVPKALVELDSRLARLLAQVAPKDAHTVASGITAPKPATRPLPTQHVNDAIGRSLEPKAARGGGKAPQTNPRTGAATEKKGGSTAAGVAGGGPGGKPPRKEKPDKVERVDEGPNSKRQESIDGDFASVYAKAPAAKEEIDKLADEIAARHGGRVAKAPIKSEKRAMEKITNDYGGDATKIKDLARNTIVVPQAKIDDVVRDLEQAGAKVKRISPAADEYGYSGVNSNLPTKAGLMSEIQVNSPEMIFAKEPEELARAIIGNDAYADIAARAGVEGGLGHKFYEAGRSLPIGDPQLEAIQVESRAYYETVRSLADGN